MYRFVKGKGKEIHEDMVKDDISWNDVMIKSVFVRDQRTLVKNVVNYLLSRLKPFISNRTLVTLLM